MRQFRMIHVGRTRHHTRRKLAVPRVHLLVLTALVALTLAVPTAARGSASQPAINSGASNSHGPHDDRDSELRAALQAIVDAGAPGIIALVDDGRRQTQIAITSSAVRPRRQLRINDQFRVASIAKTFVATIALQLVDERRLRLDDTVERWLPGAVPNGSAITVQMLLNHTSGIFNFNADPAWWYAFFEDPSRTWSPQESLDIALSHPALFEPGQGWAYSNTGYILVGLILEKATGRSLDDLVQRRIARPLQLHDTYFTSETRFRGPYAHGYLPPGLVSSDYYDVSSWSTSSFWAAGSLVSSAPDLARFYQALLSGRLISRTMRDKMLTTVDADPAWGLDSYGLGLFPIETPCGTLWGHTGGVIGYSSLAVSTLDGKRSTVFLMPTSDVDASIWQLWNRAGQIATCQMLHLPVPALDTSARTTPLPTLFEPTYAVFGNGN